MATFSLEGKSYLSTGIDLLDKEILILVAQLKEDFPASTSAT
jgi:hypothetical protein